MTTDQHHLPYVPDPRDAPSLYREVGPSERGRSRGETIAVTEDRLDLRTIYRAMMRRKGTILGIAALCSLGAAVYTLSLTPEYQSSAMLQIDRAAQKVVGFNTEVEVEEGPLSDQLQLRTQVELLKSRSLAERVIDEMGLHKPGGMSTAPETAPEVAPAASSGLMDQAAAVGRQAWSQLHALIAPTPAAPDSLSRAATVAQFQQAVTVEPVRNSRLVQITVRNADPALAAAIANTMAKNFIAMHIERRLESSVYARQFLEEQIRQSKDKLEASERVINEYAKKNQILNLGDKGSATTQTFVDFSTALTHAQQERIKAETLYNQVRLNPESAPQAVVNEAIRAYKEQRARLEADYAKNRSVFKPDYPAMVQARAQIAELDGRIKTEVNNILSSIQGQYMAAVKAEEQLKNKVAASRSEVLTVQDRSVDMNLLSRELDTNRQVYDSLLQRLREVSVTAGITTNNISIVDQASAPRFPAAPNLKVNIGLGVLLGLFLGMLAALLREQMDDSVKSVNDIEGQYRLPLLGLIPYTRSAGVRREPVALLAHREPRSTFAESYRSVRTVLQFGSAEGPPQRFMVTSCGTGEGKSTTALALAINFAQLGQRVLLIDADMRKGGLHKMLKLSNERGLSTLLESDRAIEGSIRDTTVANLGVITAGPTPPDPVELLMGPRLGTLLEQAQALGYTQIVIDGPPLLGLADAIVLGNQIPNIVLAVKAGSTRKDSMKDGLRRLRTAGLSPMGVVLTHARNEHNNDHAYAAYYGHGAPPPPRPAPVRNPPPVALPPGTRIEPTLDPSAA